MKFPSYKNISINTLKPYPKNARTHSDEQLAQIQASITEFGFTNPILIDEHHQIIAGHGRLDAAKALNFTKVPVIVLEGLTENQKKAYVIADNKLALNAGWDDDLLKSELSELLDDDFDLSLTGFSDEELDGLLSLSVNEGLTDADAVPDVENNPKTEPGDIWLLGDHRLMCGDSTQKEQVSILLNGQSPNTMITDPPYGVNYDAGWRAKATGVTKTDREINSSIINDDNTDWTEAYKLFPGNVAYVWHASSFTEIFKQTLIDAGFVVKQQIIWNKNEHILSRLDYHFKHEPCWYAVRNANDRNWKGGRTKNTVWDIPAIIFEKEKTPHPTQKPVEIYTRPLENHTSPGEYVYEPFGGSGTAIIACEKLSRRCLCMELDARYCDVIIKRWQDFTGRQAVRERDQVAFDDVIQTANV